LETIRSLLEHACVDTRLLSATLLPRLRASVHPLLGVLVVAAVLRFWQLSAMPILYFDSGAYLGEGRFLASAAERAADAWLHPVQGAPANPLSRVVQGVATGTAGHPPDLAKPGHVILLGLAMLVLGPTTLAAASVPALAGLGTVAATYALGRAGWDRRVGIVAAFLLAVSAEHLVYSREPLVESTGLFFSTLASVAYLQQIIHPRGGSFAGLVVVGLLFGASFACNNRLSFLPVSLGTVELVLWRDRGWRHWRSCLPRVAALTGGFLLPLVTIEGAFLAAQAMGRAFGANPGFLDYAHQFANFVRMNPPSRARFDQWPTFFADLGLMDGVTVLVLFLVGIVVLVLRSSWPRPNVLLATSLLLPLVLFSVYSSGEVRMRNFSSALPWAMLAAAHGLWWIAEHVPKPRAAAATALVLVGLLALPRDLAIVSAPSAVPALLATLQRESIDHVASTNGPVLSYYVGEDHTNARLAPAFINTEADLRQIAANYPFIEVDMQAYWTPGPATAAADQTTPVFQESHGSDALFLADLLESQGIAWGDWNGVLNVWRQNRGPATLMRLYRSADLVPTSAQSAAPAS
jgi:Dolichyl-phosphate-mannose-protein mannosyltransferase